MNTHRSRGGGGVATRIANEDVWLICTQTDITNYYSFTLLYFVVVFKCSFLLNKVYYYLIVGYVIMYYTYRFGNNYLIINRIL